MNKPNLKSKDNSIHLIYSDNISKTNKDLVYNFLPKLCEEVKTVEQNCFKNEISLPQCLHLPQKKSFLINGKIGCNKSPYQYTLYELLFPIEKTNPKKEIWWFAQIYAGIDQSLFISDLKKCEA